MGTIVSIGEVLWDLMPDGEYLGGAPFNFAANCARLGHRAVLVSAVGRDALGERTLGAIQASGVSAEFVRRTAEAATGIVRVWFDAEGQPHYTINRPAAYDFLCLDEQAMKAITSSDPDFVYFGTLSQLYERNQAVLTRLIDAPSGSVRFYDINLRKDSFNLELLEHLMPRAQIVKMNEHETRVVEQLFGTNSRNLEEFCRTYCRKFGWRAAWITRGPAGCAVFHDGEFLEVAGYPVASPNPVGAGDAFSAAVCHGMLENWPIRKIAESANKLGALITSQPGAVSAWTLHDIDSVAVARPVDARDAC
jgi:fructokinase